MIEKTPGVHHFVPRAIINMDSYEKSTAQELKIMAGIYKRKGAYYIKYYVGSTIIRKSLKTKSYQIAKEMQRQFESSKAQGQTNPLPTKTPLADILSKYVRYMRANKTPKSVQTDIYYLRSAFGEICPELEDTRRRTDQIAAVIAKLRLFK